MIVRTARTSALGVDDRRRAESLGEALLFEMLCGNDQVRRRIECSKRGCREQAECSGADNCDDRPAVGATE